MIALILLVLAFLCFVVAALNQTVFEQGPVDLVAWGLAAWALATLLGSPVVAAYFPRRGE